MTRPQFPNLLFTLKIHLTILDRQPNHVKCSVAMPL